MSHKLRLGAIIKSTLNNQITITNSLNEIPANLSSHLFDSLVNPIITYNCEIWYMDIYRSYLNASIRAFSTNKTVDELSYIEKKSR